jgi:hypothetical protein
VSVVTSFPANSDELKYSIMDVCDSYMNSLLMTTQDTDQIELEAQLEVLTSIARIDYPKMTLHLCDKLRSNATAIMTDSTTLPKLVVILEALDAMVANTKTQRTVLSPKQKSDANPVTAAELEAVALMTSFVIELFC